MTYRPNGENRENMKLEKNLPEYEVLTKNQVYNVPEELESEDFETITEHQVKEQNEVLKSLGLPNSNDNDISFVIHFFDSAYSNDEVVVTTLYDAIQMLAIKDGVDLVKFENGRAGFVAYYNGNDNGFEIVCEESDLLDIYFDIYNDCEEIKAAFNDNYSVEFNFDCFIEDEDNLRTLINEL